MKEKDKRGRAVRLVEQVYDGGEEDESDSKRADVPIMRWIIAVRYQTHTHTHCGGFFSFFSAATFAERPCRIQSHSASFHYFFSALKCDKTNWKWAGFNFFSYHMIALRNWNREKHYHFFFKFMRLIYEWVCAPRRHLSIKSYTSYLECFESGRLSSQIIKPDNQPVTFV